MHRMDYFALVHVFVERCVRGEPIDVIIAAFQDVVPQLGIRYFAYYAHGADPLDPRQQGFLVHNYPERWVRIYSELRLHEIDPVLRHAERSPLPFLWDAPDFRANLTAQQRRVLAAAEAFGVAHGYTIPIHLSWAPGARCASCSVVPHAEATHAPRYLELQLMASYLYVAMNRTQVAWNAVPPSMLTERERQCLALVAQGKDDWAVGRLLRLSPLTVHTYIERAKRRLEVGTRMQAVIQGLIGRQISFGDVLRAQDADREGVETKGQRRSAARHRRKKLEQLSRIRTSRRP